jgi:hypothetical protein
MSNNAEVIMSDLALERGGWLINGLHANYGAHTLEIRAEFDEGPFQLLFKGFHLLSWEISSPDYDPGTVKVDVIGLYFSNRANRKSAVLHTDLFEITLTYDELTIEKAW